MLTRNCQYCNSIFEIPKTNPKKKFCNNSCASSYNNKNRQPRSEESKNKTRQTLKDIGFKRKIFFNEENPNWKGGISKQNAICPVCGNSFQKRKNQKSCSVKCGNKLLSIWLSKNRKHIIGSKEPSWMERTFREWLEQNGFTLGINGFLVEVKFKNRNTKKYGWCDFVFPRQKLIVELDGTHHLKRKNLDDIRDQYLVSKGWNIFRISYHEYKNKSKIEDLKVLLNL